MEREEKAKEGERKRCDLMVEKLKRVGKREGKSTPSPTWKLGLLQPDGTLIEDSNFSTTLSARKLGANLWQMEPQLNHKVANINKNAPILSSRRLYDNSFAFPKELDEAASMSPSKQETSNFNFRKQLADTLAQHSARVDKAEQAQQPLSPASCSSSLEMAPRRSAISPTSSFVSNGKFGESSYTLKTSTELLKVLNRIWSLEEKHALDVSLVKTLRRELGHSQAKIQELVQEKKRDQDEIDHLMKQVSEYKVARKKEQLRIKDAVKLLDDKLEDELKLSRHSRKGHHKLVKELLQMKSSFSNVLRELDRERKARILLEDLCDEFAKGIRDYEQEVRLIKHTNCKDQIGREGNDRLILHISEAWLDERTQMKLADSCDISKQQSALDKLSLEIEALLRDKHSDTCGKSVELFPKSPTQSHTRPHSSFHLNEPASAPWHGNDEDNSTGITDCNPQLSRGCGLNQANSARQPGETTLDGHNRETTRPKLVNKKMHSRRSSDPSCSQSQIQLDEQVYDRKHRHVNEEPKESRIRNSNEMSHRRLLGKGEILQRSYRGGKARIIDADLQDATTRYPSLTSEDTNLGRDNHHMEGVFDPSTFVGPTSPVKKWTAEVSAADPDICESSSRLPNSLKPNTLKAKLIEARLELQESRTRTSKVDL